ncbi:Hypothetical predicted protein [Olea europaea subsp. europaea]|uniref:DUF1985 domain-containing protein n=1 Tax=Olea europaea subsp. europaea TaxID=158383 RepID=A0A8S0QWB7_OLEEU|nr:Hypothetical predicted protein [Olea europaea subsp. europaea]
MHLVGQIDFEFLIPEDARSQAHISQRSNLKYVKTVMDHFDEWQCEDFHNSPLGTVRTKKVNELWFNVQDHLMRFGLQEYAAVMGLRCGLFPEEDDFDRLIDKKRLKERRLLHGFRGSFARKFQKAKRRKEKEITCMVHDFPIVMQATLRPTDAEAEQPNLSTLVPVGRQSRGQDLDDRVRSGRSGDGETSGDDDSNGQSGSDRDGDDSEDCDGDDSEDIDESSTSPVALVSSPVQGLMTHTRPVGTSASSLTKGEVE